MIVPVMAISNLVLTRQREPVPLTSTCHVQSQRLFKLNQK